MGKFLSVWKHGTPEQLRRLARAYQKAALMKDLDSAERESLFLQAKGALWIAGLKEQHTREKARQKGSRATMAVQPQIKPLPENERLVNHAAQRWLKLAKITPDPNHLHLLTLARWGFANRAEGDWSEDRADAVEMQLDDLARWNSENLMKWFFANENEGDPQEQEQDLLHDLKTAKSPLHAAEMVLCTIWFMTVQDAA